jgi:hypothetical protein
LLVRGRDDHGHFDLLDPPTSNDGMAGEGRHADLMMRIRQSIMQGAKK